MNRLLFFLFLTFIFYARAANILMVFPIPSHSHNTLANEIAKGLLKRGHQLTMITPFPMTEKSENYTEVLLTGLEFKGSSLGSSFTFNESKLNMVKKVLLDDFVPRVTFEHEAVQNLLKSNKQFDVVILEIIMAESLLAFGYFYEAPTVVVNIVGSNTIISRMVANSEPYAYVPVQVVPFSDEMTFFQRLLNSVISLSVAPVYTYLSLPVQDRLLHRFFPNAPPVDDLLHNVSVILLNAHHSVIETPRPYMPNMIPVGGLHVQPQELPDDIKTYLDGADDGAVLFSLGVYFKAADLPKDSIEAILNTFAKFKQRFLVKLDDETLKVPENVKIKKWLPQRGILEHPNTKAFITQGGLLSLIEAVHYGVPLIGIPAFGDQHYNIAIAAHRKIAIKYDMNEMNEETFASAIREILENTTYKENVAKHSSLLREQPVPPLDLAVYWIEHVIKYKGAPHLRSAGVKLGWIQSHLLDVAAFLSVLCVLTVFLNVFTAKKFYNFCRRKLDTKKLKTS